MTARAESIEVGCYIAPAPDSDVAMLDAFLDRIIADIRPELERATGRSWKFHIGEPGELPKAENRQPVDFLTEASRRLAEGSFDLVLVIADAPVISRKERPVSGLASRLTRTCVSSTRRLQPDPRARSRDLAAPELRWNAAALALHLIGHAMGARLHRQGEGVMAPFALDRDRHGIPQFRDESRMEDLAAQFPAREYRTRGALHELWVHFIAALSHPVFLLRIMLRSRAPLLPLRMPGLATAAVAPIFLLVFTAEFWDAGLGMSNLVAWIYAGVSIVGATLYLSFSLRLFLPRKEDRVIPESLALANATIFLTMLFAVLGLFFMVAALSLVIETWVFPEGLISTWPTLQDPEVTFGDKLRLAAFISTVGVTTGALAGGLERREIMRELALFPTTV